MPPSARATAVAVVLVICFALCAPSQAAKDVTELRIGVKYKPDGCAEAKKAGNGDIVSVHYT
eukprot:363920-Chlamydomonas_euryale.AAC.11